MKTPTINPDEMLKSMAAEAVKQHKQIRTTIRDLTLEALQMRELSLKQINSVVREVTEGVNVGVGDGKIDVEKALSNALAGMDDALLKVVEANKGRAAETDRRWRELRGIEREKGTQGARGV